MVPNAVNSPLFLLSFRAEAETKAKLEKVTEIKKITTQMMGIKSEISKYEELLKEYQLYKKFLDDVSPQVIVSVNFEGIQRVQLCIHY